MPNKRSTSVKKDDEIMAIVPSAVSTVPAKPMVFISHDSRDADLAEALSNLLTDASGGMLRSFRSSDRKGTEGIEFGAEWYRAIMEKLGGATDVVALLTPYSLNRPWILYEAGVAKGKLDTVVFGIAMGIPLENAASGPFAQFQNSTDDEDSLTKLMLQLIRRNPDAEPRDEAVRLQVKAFRARIDNLMKQRAKPSTQPTPRVDETAIAKLFEEVKVILVDLPARLEDKLGRGQLSRHRKTLEFAPNVLMEFASATTQETNDPIGVLLIASVLREDLPWIYEMTSQIYSNAKNGNQQEVIKGLDAFEALCEMTYRAPFRREVPQDVLYLVRELPSMFRYLLSDSIHGTKKKSATKNVKSAA